MCRESRAQYISHCSDLHPLTEATTIMADKPLKSAFELAMDRLKAKDVAHGVEKATPLTKAQKSRIEALRNETQAKLAELEILHRSNVAATSDPAAIAKLEEHYAIDRGRAVSRGDTEIAKIHRAKD